MTRFAFVWPALTFSDAVLGAPLGWLGTTEMCVGRVGSVAATFSSTPVTLALSGT